MTCRIWDVWSFFTTSFVKALRQYLPDIPQADLERIITGKGKRNTFTTDQLRVEVVPYWQTELVYLVKLMNKLRELLHKADIFPSRWHGPATIANFLNKRANTAAAMNRNLPERVLDASQFAYAAGRVEQFKVGRAGKTVYKYDLNSAYPAAMVELPSLGGEWSYRESDGITDLQDFGLYFLEYNAINHIGSVRPQALFHRTKEAFITFPRLTTGWYWAPEAKNAFELNNAHPGICTIRAAWEMDTNTCYRPFEWVAEMYQRRLEMKRAGEQSQLALKLGLNSLYGKQAQRAGYDRYQKIPDWHQYEWAGPVTSATRARMHKAASLAAARDSLIGIETDAVFTTEPLPELTVGDGLGQWGLEVFDDCVYLQTGVYWLLHTVDCDCKPCRSGQSKWHPKFRGMDADTLTLDMALRYLECTSLNVKNITDYADQPMTGMSRTRFVGSKAALHVNRLEDWRVWKTDPVQLSVGASFKRVHIPMLCSQCKNGNNYAHDVMHDMATTICGMGASHATKLPWRTVTGEAVLWDHEKEDDPAFQA